MSRTAAMTSRRRYWLRHVIGGPWHLLAAVAEADQRIVVARCGWVSHFDRKRITRGPSPAIADRCAGCGPW